MDIPEGKTPAIIQCNVHQSLLKEGDQGYIDGYVRGGDGRPCVAFVRRSDGAVDLVTTHQILAVSE